MTDDGQGVSTGLEHLGRKGSSPWQDQPGLGRKEELTEKRQQERQGGSKKGEPPPGLGCTVKRVTGGYRLERLGQHKADTGLGLKKKEVERYRRTGASGEACEV